MFFQNDIYDIMSILDFIIVLLQVIGFCGLIIFGILRTRNSGTINKSVVFPIVGVINIIYLTINERISYLVVILLDPYLDPDLYTIYIMVRYELTYMIPTIISLITFGALFLYLGVRNRENFGKHLKYSGIFWIVCGVILIVSYSILLLSYIPGLIPYPRYLSSFIMIPIASIFMVTSSIFFVIYAAKIYIKILLYSSIILLIASSVFAFNSLLQLIAIFS